MLLIEKNGENEFMEKIMDITQKEFITYLQKSKNRI